jgi:hypothetical protein
MRPLVQCGEYSLAVYCISVLLSFAAHAALNLGWNDLISQTLVSAAGIAVIAATAGLLTRIDRNANHRPRILYGLFYCESCRRSARASP